MTRILDISRAFYLLVLGISAGAIIATGALSAPVIFNMDSILGLGISNAESGLVMGNIFSRLNYVLLALMIVMIIYEIVCVNMSMLLRFNRCKCTYSLHIKIVTLRLNCAKALEKPFLQPFVHALPIFIHIPCSESLFIGIYVKK